MADPEEFVFDSFRDQPDKLPQDQMYDRFRAFVKKCGENLLENERHLDEAFGEVWDIADPIAMVMLPDDTLTLEEVLGEKTKENPLFYKVVLVMSSLVSEMGDLVEEAKCRLFPALSVFGEQPLGKEIKTGEEQLTFARMLPTFLDLWNFCSRSYNVIENVIRQFASIYNDRNRKRPERKGLVPIQTVHFTGVWAALADLVAVLISLDQIIMQNDSFHQTCTLFKRLLKNAKNQPEKYQVEGSSAKRFGILLDKLEIDLFDNLIFQRCIDEKLFDFPEEQISVRDNLLFMHEFDFELREIFENVRKGAGLHPEVEKRERFMGVCGLFVMYYLLFRDKLKGKAEEKKLFKTLFDVHKAVPIIHVYGNTTFSPAEWLARTIPELANAISRDPQKDHAAACNASLAEYKKDMEQRVNKYFQDAMVWSSRFESQLITRRTEDLVDQEGVMILQGVYYANEIRTLLTTVLSLHVTNQVPLSVDRVLLLCRCVELLKSIQTTFHRKSAIIWNLMTILCEHIAYRLQRMLLGFRKKLKDNQAKLDEVQIDQLSGIELSLRVLHGPPARNALIVVKNALHIVTSKTGGMMKDTDFENMHRYLRRLEMVSNWMSMITQACDCSFLYWHYSAVFPTYLTSIIRDPTRGPSLPYMVLALHDASKVLVVTKHLSDKQMLLESYIKDVEKELQEGIIKPLCREVENTLRLNIHSVVLGQQRHQLGGKQYKDYQHLLNLPAIRFFGKRYLIRDFVQHYLETQFYNLTALQPHDWKTYEEARALAKEKYNLDLTEAHLPGQIMDQGLDALEITRSIRLFATRYTYNLNNQVFIERPNTTESKHLNTVHIRHIANSIRTHGTGMMTTTVNFLFKFLTNKFNVFSQFLFDDQVKSRLIKDLKWYQEHRAELKNRYPMKRAEKFVSDIRRLGKDDTGASYLDQFRRLITEIGNGLGYVRMVRTGGMRAVSSSISFVPSLEDIPQFESMLEDENFRKNPDDEEEEVPGEIPESTVEAAKILDSVLSNQMKRLTDPSEYFKLFENVFKDELNSEKNKHLQNFYIIIPPLTISFVDHMVASKDRLTKKGREASFSDDGFALGVAFILKLLGLTDSFDSLHWFTSIDIYYKLEKQRVDEQMARAQGTSKKDAKGGSEEQGEISTLNLTANRIRTLRKEYELLLYAFRSAKVFFKDQAEEEEESESETVDEDDLDEA